MLIGNARQPNPFVERFFFFFNMGRCENKIFNIFLKKKEKIPPIYGLPLRDG